MADRTAGGRMRLRRPGAPRQRAARIAHPAGPPRWISGRPRSRRVRPPMGRAGAEDAFHRPLPDGTGLGIPSSGDRPPPCVCDHHPHNLDLPATCSHSARFGAREPVPHEIGSILALKPCTSMIACVQPCAEPASTLSARRWLRSRPARDRQSRARRLLPDPIAANGWAARLCDSSFRR